MTNPDIETKVLAYLFSAYRDEIIVGESHISRTQFLSPSGVRAALERLEAQGKVQRDESGYDPYWHAGVSHERELAWRFVPGSCDPMGPMTRAEMEEFPW
jgi:hypothetical protein